jgi:hypothetical protein
MTAEVAFYHAVVDDHAGEQGCDNTCDITAALRAGLPRVAAYLLSGATEAPAVEAVAAHCGEDWAGFGHRDADDPDWLRWCQWFEANTVRCPRCESYVFTDAWPQYTCGNCGADLTDLGVEP